jgi:Protein of unknown function (DUF3592)
MELADLVEMAKALATGGVAVAAISALVTLGLLLARHGALRSLNGGCLIGAIPLLLPLIFVTMAAGFGRPQLLLYRDGVQTTGRVVANAEHTGDGTAYSAIIAYQTADGRAVRFEDLNAYNPPRHAIGDTVNVLYMPDAPDSAVIHNSVWWVVPALMLAGAATAWVVALAITVPRFRNRTLTTFGVIHAAVPE